MSDSNDDRLLHRLTTMLGRRDKLRLDEYFQLFQAADPDRSGSLKDANELAFILRGILSPKDLKKIDFKRLAARFLLKNGRFDYTDFCAVLQQAPGIHYKSRRSKSPSRKTISINQPHDTRMSASGMNQKPAKSLSPTKSKQLGSEFLSAEKQLSEFLSNPLVASKHIQSKELQKEGLQVQIAETSRCLFNGAERFLDFVETIDQDKTGLLHEDEFPRILAKCGIDISPELLNGMLSRFSRSAGKCIRYTDFLRHYGQNPKCVRARRELKQVLCHLFPRLNIPTLEWLHSLRRRFEKFDKKVHGELKATLPAEIFLRVIKGRSSVSKISSDEAAQITSLFLWSSATSSPSRIQYHEFFTLVDECHQIYNDKVLAITKTSSLIDTSEVLVGDYLMFHATHKEQCNFEELMELMQTFHNKIEVDQQMTIQRISNGIVLPLDQQVAITLYRAMVNKQKSKCQLRLEARSRACFALASASSDSHHLAAELQSRIARANEIRAMHTRQLAARARARVLHAQDVARGMRVKRHEELRRFRQSSVSKLNEAARRRHEQLEQLQLQCKQRAELITEKVELVRADQSDRADRARRILADQLDDAARRRREQTQQRVRRLNERWQSVESVKDRVARVKFIQRWFRRQVATHKTAKALRQAQADVSRVVSCWREMHSASFEECMGLLQQRSVIAAAQRLLKVLMADNVEYKGQKQSIKRTISRNQQTTSSSPQGGMSFRVLMMAGMIACHPSEILGRDPSKRLLYAARAIVSNLEGLALLLAASNGSQRIQALTQSASGLSARFTFYKEAFARWKQRDAERLAVELLTSYRELMMVQQKYEMQALEAQNGVDGVHELLRQTHGQLRQMQQALKRLLGKEEAQRKIESLEQQLQQGDGSENNTTRKSNASSYSENSASSSTNETTTSPSLPLNTAEGGNQNKKDDEDDDMQEENISEDEGSGAFPSALNQALFADRKLVHELILNPQLQISREKDIEASAAAMGSQQSVAAVAVRVREAMTKAFWDGVIEANDIETLLARTEELRTGFRDALGGGSGTGLGTALSTLANRVDSALNRAQLRELMQDPMKNISALQMRCNCVLDAIESAEAPARAASTQEFRSHWFQSVVAGGETPVQLLVAFLAFALDKVEELRVDVLNAHLGLLGAYLQRHGVEYEQKQLQARLVEAGSVDAAFPMTMKWLGVEMEAYLARSDVEREERSRLAAHDGEAFERFLRVSMWALVEKHIDGSSSRVWPETFELDIERIRSCRDALDRIAVVSSLVAMVQEYASRYSLTLPIGYLSTVSQQLSTLLQSPGVSGAQLAAHAAQCVRQLESSDTEETQQALKALESRLLGSFAESNPVFQLFFSRLSSACELSLLQNTPVKLHPSLTLFAAEIHEVTVVLRRLAQHNEKVYASLYNCIIKRLVPPL